MPSGRLQFLISQSLSDGVILYSSIFSSDNARRIIYTFQRQSQGIYFDTFLQLLSTRMFPFI